MVCIVLLASWAFAYQPTEEELKNDLLKNKKPLETLDPARNTWKALEIGVDGAPEFSEEHYMPPSGKPWSFKAEAESGIKGMINISDFKASDDAISFATGNDAEIFWADHYEKNPKYGEETIGKTWWGHWHPIWLRARIKQSLPQTAGEIFLRPTGSRPSNRMKTPIQLKGTDWQTIEIKTGDSRTSYASLSLLFSEPGNRIEISDLSIFTRHLVRIYEKNFDVTDEIERAAFCLVTAPWYKVYVNGSQYFLNPPENRQAPGCSQRPHPADFPLRGGIVGKARATVRDTLTIK